MHHRDTENTERRFTTKAQSAQRALLEDRGEVALGDLGSPEGSRFMRSLPVGNDGVADGQAPPEPPAIFRLGVPGVSVVKGAL